MPFYDDNETLRSQYEQLPQNIKNHKITTSEELTELVRRIITVKLNKLP